MGSSASVPVKGERPDGCLKSVVDILTRLEGDIKLIEDTTNNTKRLNAFISASREQRTDDDKVVATVGSSVGSQDCLVTDTVEKTQIVVRAYCGKLENNLDITTRKLHQLLKAVTEKCLTRNTVVKENIRAHILLIDEMLLESKTRLAALKKNNAAASTISEIEKMVRENELVRTNLLGGDRSMYNDGETTRYSTVNEDLDEEWRLVAIQMKSTNESLTKENKTLQTTIQERDNELLHLKAMLSKQTCDPNVSRRLEEANEYVQKIEEQILEERLTHEVEINELKAIIEQLRAERLKTLSPSPNAQPKEMGSSHDISQKRPFKKKDIFTDLKSPSFEAWIGAFDQTKKITSDENIQHTMNANVSEDVSISDSAEPETQTIESQTNTSKDLIKIKDKSSGSGSKSSYSVECQTNVESPKEISDIQSSALDTAGTVARDEQKQYDDKEGNGDGTACTSRSLESRISQRSGSLSLFSPMNVSNTDTGTFDDKQQNTFLKETVSVECQTDNFCVVPSKKRKESQKEKQIPENKEVTKKMYFGENAIQTDKTEFDNVNANSPISQRPASNLVEPTGASGIKPQSRQQRKKRDYGTDYTETDKTIAVGNEKDIKEEYLKPKQMKKPVDVNNIEVAETIEHNGVKTLAEFDIRLHIPPLKEAVEGHEDVIKMDHFQESEAVKNENRDSKAQYFIQNDLVKITTGEGVQITERNTVEEESNQTNEDLDKNGSMLNEHPQRTEIFKESNTGGKIQLHVCKEDTTKEIVYRRNDSELVGNLSFHKGFGAVIRTNMAALYVDSITCDIEDALENDMLPDFVEEERIISFQLRLDTKPGSELTIQDGEWVKVFLPHRPTNDNEEVSLICCQGNGDWEPCDIINERPESILGDIRVIGATLKALDDVRIVAIARERMDHVIAGEADVNYSSRVDPTVTVTIDKNVFKKRTEVKIQVHTRHRQELSAAVETHLECQQIMSCTPFVSIVCEDRTVRDISLVLQLQQDSDECRYVLFMLEDSGWKLADCSWREHHLTVHLRPGSKRYRVLGLELPAETTVEEKLLAVRTIHEHTGHYLARLVVRQREDDPTQAVVVCLRTNLIKKAIAELRGKGYSVGNYPSSQFCLHDRDVLTLSVSGNLVASPVQSETADITFCAQREMSIKMLCLHPVPFDPDMRGAQTDGTSGVFTASLSVRSPRKSTGSVFTDTLVVPLK